MMPCCALSLNCADIILLHLVTSTIRQDRDIGQMGQKNGIDEIDERDERGQIDERDERDEINTSVKA